jgi:hypothetical protein
MSKSLVWALAAVLLAPPLASQDTLVARMRRRADSLLTTWREARAFADLADSLERERAIAGRDTIAVGALRIIANPSSLPLRAAAERAWPAIDSLFGSAAAELTHQPYVIRAVDPDPAVRRTVLHVGIELPWDLDLAATTRVLIATVAAPRFDHALGQWLGGPLRPLPRPADERREVFLQLVTAPSTAVRACFLGATESCVDVLQLRDTAGLVERWYATAAEREALVLNSFAGYFDRAASAATLRSCRTHDDNACTTLLRSLPPGTLPRPLGYAARASLIREALRIGGREGYRRLVRDSTASLSQRLGIASGVSLDSLVTAWRLGIIASRAAPLTLPWWATVAALGWTAFFGCCALRSTRWRL